MSDIHLIPVTKGGEYLEVHPSTLADHKRLGWTECEKREQEDPEGGLMREAPLPGALQISFPARGRRHAHHHI